MPLKVTVAFPNGATLPGGLARMGPLEALATDAVPLKPARVIAVVVWPTVMFPEPVSVKAPPVPELFACVREECRSLTRWRR